MVKGVGTDIIEIARIRSAFERYGERFLRRILLPEEISYCLAFQDPAPALAARFAAKEAVVKALGLGFGPEINFHDIEVVKNSRGQPGIKFSTPFMQKFQEPSCLITLSHCKEYATATALWI